MGVGGGVAGIRGFVGRSSGNSSSKYLGNAPVACACAVTRCSSSRDSSYTKLSRIWSPRIVWHAWRMRGCSVSIQALTIASSADMLSPHPALSKPLNLYTLVSFRLRHLPRLPTMHYRKIFFWTQAIVSPPAIFYQTAMRAVRTCRSTGSGHGELAPTAMACPPITNVII